jgi:hypothetical protein
MRSILNWLTNVIGTECQSDTTSHSKVLAVADVGDERAKECQLQRPAVKIL